MVEYKTKNYTPEWSESSLFTSYLDILKDIYNNYLNIIQINMINGHDIR